ncbi:hypothetical protein BBBOND_0310510 [Babesia bigemina]|uniref:Ribosome binding protein n=1 Tax=Babesia bigemina TaxID=5866 RepID=A0A061D9C5_BABBI|nr:hypothetical protein BBBOND_0310510 [Babesia bigemina]CDR97148.1 hypothetical protein BBBOND_0310510 [Babesia bigemina]|eukprot:XP_012769334.1 hypothetical protein BBBOND_0310510 [Babesia bigemina]
MASAVGIKLTSLKECLIFLNWLYEREGKRKLDQVANKLHERLKPYYKDLDYRKIKSSLSTFMTTTDHFYKRLVKAHVPTQLHSNNNSMPRDPNVDQVVDALLECIPKFLAAMYYLWYDVNATFDNLGGGGWKNDYPGYEKHWYTGHYGGDLQKYLRSTNPNDYGGTIPGGFGENEVKYAEYYTGYYQGLHMALDLKSLLDKNSSKYNLFRDIFATSVVPASGNHKANTANVLALVKAFCQVVENDSDGSKLIKVVQKPETCINWPELKKHCTALRGKIDKLFTRRFFDHTGQSINPKHINAEKFAETTANWLRENLGTVRSKLERINTKDAAVNAPNSRNLGAYFTNNLFPYGFVFEANHHLWNGNNSKALLQRWREVIEMLSKDDEASGGLKKLIKLLNGDDCPAVTKTKATKPNVVTPSVEGGVKSAPKSAAKTPQTARPVVTKAEAAKPVATKTEAAKPVATKTEATKPVVNQEGTSRNQNSGRSDGKPTTSSVETSSSSLSSGSAGASGPTGTQGGKGQKGPGSTTSTTSTPKSTVTSQKTSSQQSSSPPQASLPSAPAAPGSPSKPGVTSKGSDGGGGPGQKSGGSSQPGQHQLPSVSPPRSPSSNASSPGQGQGKSGPADSSGFGTQGGQDQGSQGGDHKGQQPDSASSSVQSQAPGVQRSGAASSGASVPGQGSSTDADPKGGKGKGSPGGTLTTQQTVVTSPPGQRQAPSGTSQVTQSTGASGTGGGQGSASVPGKPGAKGQGANGGGNAGTQPGISAPPGQPPTTAVQSPASPQSPGVHPPTPPSSSAPAPGGSQGTSDQATTSGTTQQNDQSTSHTSTAATTTTSAGSGGGGGGQGQTFAATDAQTVINSPRSPQIHSFPPPEIDVIYGPQKISENLEEAYRKVLQKNMKSVPPNLSIEITKPPTSDTDNSKDAPLVVLHDPTEFGLGGAVASDEDEPVVLGVGGEPITSDSDVFKQQHIAEIQDVHQKLYEKQKAEDLELKKALEAGAKRQHQDTLWSENMDDVLRKEEETEEMRKNLQDDTLGEVVKIPFNTKICAPENIIQRAVHGFNTYPPPIIDIRAVDSKNIYSIPDGSNKLVNVPDPKQLPTLDIIRAYIPRSYDINPPNISQDEYNSAASPVLFDITKPTRPTDEDDDDKSFQHMDDVKSVLIGVNPAYEVIDDGLEISKVTHTDAEETVDLFIETLNTAPSQPLHDYDPENIPMIKVQADHTRDGLDDFSMGDADRSDINIPMAVFPDQSPDDLNTQTCQNPWYVTPSSTSPTSPPASRPPESDHLPPPRTVREMLYWFVGLNTYGYIGIIREHVYSFLKRFKNDAIDVTLEPYTLDASHVADKLTEACLYAAHVLFRIRYKGSSDAYETFFKDQDKYAYYYSPDPACLLCQLRDYAYACHHQLEFLKSQCERDKLSGGWQNCNYGSDPKKPSPLQAFLTDAYDSTFKTHLFDPCNLCLKSRVRMGFQRGDLPKTSQQGSVISSIITPSCGGEDPLLTLSSYLICLTRRTPRTTGELVSYFHNFGNEMHDAFSKSLLPLGSSLSTPHLDCPDWDHIDRIGLQAVRGIRGTESLNSISNHNHDKDHPRTLSTLVGCGSDPDNCHPHCSPITYRAYALYSQRFAHTYLSWTVYLPDRLRESLQKLHYALKKHVSIKCSYLHLCPDALPLLYLHGFTPPEVGSQQQLKCSDVIEKLQEIVNGGPIASLMTAMDNFLYGIREPFIFTLVALWSLALLICANTMLYRLDVLHIRSHLIRSKASHRMDVKALLTKGRKMLSLYKDVDYFDEDPIVQLGF